MDLTEALTRRRMVRSFRDQPIDAEVLGAGAGRRHPGPVGRVHPGRRPRGARRAGQRASYWDTTLAPERRASFPWPGLLVAPVLVVVCTDPGAYTWPLRRGRQADHRPR